MTGSPEDEPAASQSVPGPLPVQQEAAGASDQWHRLHPLSPLVSAGPRFAGVVVVLFGITFARQRQASADLITDLVIVAVVLVAGFVRWLVTRWQVTGGVLRIDTGLLRRDSRRFPLSQVQAIDIVQTGLARVLGLAELRLRVAGGDASRGGRLACLRRADAELLREQLLVLAGVAAARAPASGSDVAAGAAPPASLAGVRWSGASGAPPDGAAAGGEAAAAAFALPGPSAAAGDRLLFRVQTGRLVGAVLLSRTGAVALLAIAILVGIGVWTRQPGVVASFLPVFLGAVLGTWRQFSANFGTTVAAAPGGLRLRSGLIETAAETIRPGRVQAVRLVEPLIWRAFGWCRLEVDVAGPRERREVSAEGKRLRALIPVGSRAEAAELMGELLASQPVPSLRPPATARWKAPLMYHFLAYASDGRYLAAADGRVCRKTTWVPLEKVQSLRWTQGPLQRRFGLASVWLDVAGRRMSAGLRERGTAEAEALMARLPGELRAARARRL